jgi:hypothetical protein
MYQQLHSQWTFMKFDIKQYGKELSCHINFYLDGTILMTTLHEDLRAFAPQSNSSIFIGARNGCTVVTEKMKYIFYVQ